jgi:hypothetical protein
MQFFQLFDHWLKLLMIGAYGLRRAITQSENHQFWKDQKTGGGTEFNLVDKPQYEEHGYRKRQGDHNGERRLMGCINPALGAPLYDHKKLPPVFGLKAINRHSEDLSAMPKPLQHNKGPKPSAAKGIP